MRGDTEPSPRPPSPLALDLQMLANAPLATTARTDEAALAFQIARVQERRPQDRARVPQLLKALQILAHLAQTDACEWEEHLAWLWSPAKARQVVSRRQRVIPRASANVIGLTVNVLSARDVEKLGSQLIMCEHEHDTAPPPVQIPVWLDLRFVEANMGAALATVGTLTTPPSPVERTTNPRPYRVAGVCNIKRVVSDVEWLCRLAELAARGVVVSDFPHLTLCVSKQTAAQVVSSLQLLFTKRRSHRRAGACGSQPTVQLVKLIYGPQDPVAAMLVSAIGKSSSVREVTAQFNQRYAQNLVGAGPSAGPTVAQWFAFSLFSRESHHRIRRIALDYAPQSAFSHQQVRDVLQADDPVAAMFPEHAESIAQYANARLTASDFVLFDPDNVVDDGDATENATLMDHPHAERGRRQIPDMSVTVHTTEELTQTLSWLSYVGSGARIVSLSREALSAWRFARDRNDASPVVLDWNDAQMAFPNVQKLRLARLRVCSLVALADWIGSPQCRLQHLRLFNVSALETDPGMPAFLDLLSDEHHPMAKTLQSLSVVATDSGQAQAEITAAALRMLTTNRFLCSFDLHVRSPGEQSEVGVDYAAMHAAFLAHDNTPLYPYLRKRLALLSAVAHSSGGMLQSLDSSIFTDIFYLAELGRRRSVKVVFSSH